MRATLTCQTICARLLVLMCRPRSERGFGVFHDVAVFDDRAGATTRPDEWVLNGQKARIKNGGVAAVHVVVASVEPELKSRRRRPSRFLEARKGQRPTVRSPC